MTSVAHEAWFQDPKLQRVLHLLNGDGGEGRVVGGAVRNALMGLSVTDMDIATSLKPEEVQARAHAAGVKCVPTGIAHGTVTLVVDGQPFEVTTLRRDVETFGRHAQVEFTDDWKADAERRDLTINALYADIHGEVHDHVGGLADLAQGMVRFIGDPAARIAEDYLRILRFFRFFAQYGRGRPDAAGLKACSQAKSHLSTLSAERVWAELRKTLGAADPGRALLWMRTTGVLTEILPESEKWGIDAIPGLLAAEAHFRWKAEPLLRLAAIVPPQSERLEAMADRLRLANAERAYLAAFAATPPVADTTSEQALAERLYRNGPQGVIVRLKLAIGTAFGATDAAGMAKLAGLQRLLSLAENWQKPALPVNGADLMAKSIEAGPKLGAALAQLETAWIQSGFKLGKAELLALLPPGG